MKTFAEITAIITSELTAINFGKQPLGLYSPIDYVMQLGGKRIRPALALMACNLFKNDVSAVIAPALGIEVFHNFTLLHDDIMDRAPIRRGRATVHEKWNDNTAILSGDVMQIIAYQMIAKTPEIYLKKVLDIFSKTAIEICEGQQYDVDFENRMDVSITEYIEMIRLKTAVLLACALKIGAIIGGASDQDAENLYEFGIQIGLAFQLKDDYLDAFGDEKTFGKRIGGDILCNKKTFLLLTAISKASDEKKNELFAWLNVRDKKMDSQKVEAVTLFYTQLGVDKSCEDKMNEYYQTAIAALDKVSIDDCNKQELRILADKLMFRND